MTHHLTGVLLVEDDDGDALLVRECLREAGLSEDDLIWCRTLAEGVDALVDKPSCVLLDLGLPDASGLEALHTVVAEVSAAPVIVLTGRHDRTGVEAVAAGAQDYLIKDDLTPELLDRTIRYAVQRRQTQVTEVQLREERLLAAENSRLVPAHQASRLLAGARRTSATVGGRRDGLGERWPGPAYRLTRLRGSSLALLAPQPPSAGEEAAQRLTSPPTPHP